MITPTYKWVWKWDLVGLCVVHVEVKGPRAKECQDLRVVDVITLFKDNHFPGGRGRREGGMEEGGRERRRGERERREGGRE